MSAPARLLAELRAHGAQVRLDGDQVWIGGVSAAALPVELLAAARAHRAELVQLLRAEETPCPPVRPGPTLEADLVAAWSWAAARARQGFARTGTVPDAECLRGATALELEVGEGRVPGGAGLLRAVYAGRLAVRLLESGRVAVLCCRGCAAPMQPHPGGLCFACDLGLDHGGEAPARVRVAVELRQKLGPAGSRGARREAIDAELRRRKEERGR